MSAVSSGAALLLALTATHAVATPRVERAGTAADGTQGDGSSNTTVTTPNGRFVAFRSSATNLDRGDHPPAHTNGVSYVFLRTVQ